MIDESGKTKFSEGDLVIARYLERNKNGYMLCEIIRSVGRSGDIESEKKGLLLEYGIEKKDFPKAYGSKPVAFPTA